MVSNSAEGYFLLKWFYKNFLTCPFASFSNHRSRKIPNALIVLVNVLPQTLQISSRASTYRSCFEHFPFFTRSSSQHNTQRPKASACQKPFLFFLSAMSSPSKSAKSLEEPPVPLQPNILWCVVWEKLLSGKVSQKFLCEPHQVVCLAMGTFVEYWTFPLARSDRLGHVAALMISVSSLHLLLPALASPQPQSLCWQCLCRAQQLTAASPHCWAVPGGCPSWHRQAVPAEPGDHSTARLTDCPQGQAHPLGSGKIVIIPKQSLGFDSKTDTRLCAPDFNG